MMPPRRWLPRTLFGQTLLLVAGLIVAAQVTGLLLFQQLVQKPRIAAMAYHTRAHLDAVQSALRHLPPEHRQQFTDDLTLAGTTLVQVGGDIPPQPMGWAEPMLQYALNQLGNQLGQDRTLVWHSEPERRLWVRVPLDDAHYWIGLSTDGLLPNTGLSMLGALLSTALLALAGAWLIQRRVNRPLQQLVAAAAAIGQGQPPQGLPHDAPQEIAALAESFRQMSQSLTEQDREREIMLAGVSHDLRTPLTKLRLAVAMLPELPPDGPSPPLTESMERQIQSIDAIVGQFVAFARFGGDEVAVHTDLNALVAGVAANLLAPEQPQHIDLAPRLPSVPVRPVALGRAVANLLENARRYAPGPVTLRTWVGPQGIAIAVTDAGPGIPADQMARLRQPFERLDTARSQHSGAGLGLAIVERVVRLHHGSLDMANAPGGGLSVTLWLPHPVA